MPLSQTLQTALKADLRGHLERKLGVPGGEVTRASLQEQIAKTMQRALDHDQAKEPDTRMGPEEALACQSIITCATGPDTPDASQVTRLSTALILRAHLMRLEDDPEALEAARKSSQDKKGEKDPLTDDVNDKLGEAKKTLGDLPDPNEKDPDAWKKAIEDLDPDALEEAIKKLKEAIDAAGIDRFDLTTLLTQLENVVKLKRAYTFISDARRAKDEPLLDSELTHLFKNVLLLLRIIT